MRKFLLKTLLLTLFSGIYFLAQGQIVISTDILTTTSNLKMAVVDSAGKRPVPYASVFLVPKGDSIITNFTVTDTLGKASFNDVTRGTFLLNIEMTGYHPLQKEIYVSNNEDLGQFILKEKRELLESASVTAYVDPIKVTKDTITYNATAFGATESEMLGDMLKRMPGMEVDNNGNVKVQGQSIKKITVEGRTFFFDDKKTALNNLPAKLIDKIRVIDKESEQAERTGIADVQKEKVMDLELKAEFKQGFFGNISLKGGATIDSKKEENTLKADRGALYNGNALAAAYKEKMQLTVVGNASNVTDPNSGALVIFRSLDDEPNQALRKMMNGIKTTGQIGANLNTESKDLMLDGTLNLNSQKRDAAERSMRTTTTQNSNSFITESSSEGNEANEAISLRLQFKNKQRKKIDLNFEPTLTFGRTAAEYRSSSETTSDVSQSQTHTSSSSEGGNWNTGGEIDLTFKDLKKTGRSLTLESRIDLSGSHSTEFSKATYSSREEMDLRYNGNSSSKDFSGVISWSEPLGKNLKLNTTLEGRFAHGEKIRDAFGRNAVSGEYTEADSWWSSTQSNRDLEGIGKIVLQWKKETNLVQVGANAGMSKKITESYSKGVSSVNGDEWLFTAAPSLTMSHNDQNYFCRLNYSGNLQNPGRSSMLPVPDISNAMQISVGNIYLRRPFRHSGSITLYKNNTPRISFYSTGSVTKRGLVSASWFDSNSIRYAVPVNSGKPQFSATFGLNYDTPLDKKKQFNFSLGLTPSITTGTSYQASGIMAGLDLDNFSYSDFMALFWGNDIQGTRFYSGASGFRESRTFTYRVNGSASISYRNKKMNLSLSYTPEAHFSRYSLNPAANSNTCAHYFKGYGRFTLPKKFEFYTNASYTIYQGYREGFNKPDFKWNASLEKSVKAFTFSLTVQDILNSAQSIYHNSGEDWYEDTQSLIMNRFILFGVKWNFGKMNPSNMNKARNATFNMMQ